MNELGLFSVCMHPRDVKPGMTMWAPEFGKPMVIKEIEELPPKAGRPEHHIDYGWRIEYTERCAGRTWPRDQEIRIY